jgi:AcrR family transcriptional regulator
VSRARSAEAKPRRTQQERREATIGKLLEATIGSMLEVGFARTTVKEICQRAGVSHGALFRFFPSVLDLVLAAGEEVARRQIAEFEERFAKSDQSGDRLATALVLLREACRSETNTVFYELLVAARTDRDLRKALEPAMKRYYEAIHRTARQVPGSEAFAPEDLEVLLFTAIHTFDGEALARIVHPQPRLEERRMALLIGVLRSAAGG